MKKTILIALIILGSFSVGLATAADSSSPTPEVRIVKKGENTIEEYRINGHLYMIKVTPKKGLPYYLIDNNGDGVLETRRNDLDPDVVIPRWTIFSW